MKKLTTILLIIFLLTSCAGGEQNSKKEGYEKFSDVYYGPDNTIQVFDTAIEFLAYTKNKEEFNKYFKILGDEFLTYHKLYDNYHEYDGINNIMTINLNAGKKPVKVDQRIIDILKFSKDNYEKTLGKTNIAMGAVIDLWHVAREKIDAENAKYAKNPDDNVEEVNEKLKTYLPKEKDLLEANKHTDIKNLIIDEKEKTVFLKDPKMSLDLGAVAKGYATEQVARSLEKKGLDSGIISAGGNVRTIGKSRKEGALHWGIAIQNPDLKAEKSAIEVFYVDENTAVVTSGDYQRFSMVDGKRIHHIIDPVTLAPSKHFRSVSIFTNNSGLADFLSTALFNASREEGEKILKNYEKVGAFWVDDELKTYETEEIRKNMSSKGSKIDKEF